MSVFRRPWDSFPALCIHAEERMVKHHPDYAAAKSGDPASALVLVRAMASETCAALLSESFARKEPVLVAAHAVESDGVNAIPQAMAAYLSSVLAWPVEHSIVQTNVVWHTGADGFSRLSRQAEFTGPVLKGANYVLVDDFVGQGGTLANLRGYLMHHGGVVLGGTVLTGKPYSASLPCDEEQIRQLREKHGPELESWWTERFGFGYACLTRSETRYLLNTPSAERIRDRIAAAVEAGNFGIHRGDPRQ